MLWRIHVFPAQAFKEGSRLNAERGGSGGASAALAVRVGLIGDFAGYRAQASRLFFEPLLLGLEKRALGLKGVYFFEPFGVLAPSRLGLDDRGLPRGAFCLQQGLASSGESVTPGRGNVSGS